MPTDARVGAWLHAWGRVESAQKMLRDDVRGDLMITKEYRTRHNDLMAQAGILARLACAPEEVGESAGEYLQQEEIRKADAKQHVEEVLKHLGRS